MRDYRLHLSDILSEYDYTAIDSVLMYGLFFLLIDQVSIKWR